MGTAEIFRIHASYFLGMTLAETAPESARPHLERVLHIDPMGSFAERAYQKLSEL